MNYRYYVAVMASAAVTATMMISPAAPCAAQNPKTVILDAGTVIPVRLRDTISSIDSQKGDRFSATLQSEEAARSLRLPVGTIIQGTVSAVRPMEGKEPGVVALKFDRVVLPDESSYPIQGSLTGLDSKSVTRASDGRLIAKADQKNKTLIYAGYGAGAGLVLGALTRGNTILDTLIGGGLGYLLGSLDKSHGDPRDVLLKPNTEMGVRLDRSITVQYDEDRYGADRYNDRDYRGRTDRNGEPYRSDRYRNRQDSRDAEGGIARYGSGSRVLNQYADVSDNGEPVRVLLNGRRLSFLSTNRPYFSGGTIMVPAVTVLQADSVRYSSTQSRFIVEGPGETYTGTIGSRYVTGTDDRQLTLPAAIQRRNGAIFVPMQFLALVTGRSLSFDRDTQTIEFGRSRALDSDR